jgi:hypothetical protein
MIRRETRGRPESWAERKAALKRGWALPWYAIEFSFDWTAYFLSRWAFLEVLEYLGVFSVLFAVIFYYSEAGDRKKQKHYQAWQVINTAQGKGGSGGRIEALQELNADREPLAGVDISGAFLQGVKLENANLIRANFGAADLRDSNFAGSDLEYADLQSANLRKADLRSVDLFQADLEDADLVGAVLRGANLSHVNLKNADLRDADLQAIRWQEIGSLESANIFGVRNAPDGFAAWALRHGAIAEKGAEE